MYEYKATLLRVIDGDTVDCLIDLGFDVILRERVRLINIDAPETRTKDLQEKKWGLEAKERLQTLLNRYPYFIVKTTLHRGKFGRTLGELFLQDGLNINETLIQEGFAERYGD